jgi:hypothetical protein
MAGDDLPLFSLVTRGMLTILLLKFGNSGIEMPMKIRSSLYSAAFSGALCFTMLASPASADIKDPQADGMEIISQGMRSAAGDIFSQGMTAGGSPWAGEVYSQGMMMSTGEIYSQGMQITTLGSMQNPIPDMNGIDTVASPGGTTISPPPSQACAGTAPNCTDNVTNTPAMADPPNNNL